MNAPATALTIRRLDSAAPGFAADLAALISFESAQDPAIDTAVATIVAAVRARGDAALLEYTAKFDRLVAPSVAALEITAAQMRAAFDALPADQRAAHRQSRCAQVEARCRAAAARRDGESGGGAADRGAMSAAGPGRGCSLSEGRRAAPRVHQ